MGRESQNVGLGNPELLVCRAAVPSGPAFLFLGSGLFQITLCAGLRDHSGWGQIPVPFTNFGLAITRRMKPERTRGRCRCRRCGAFGHLTRGGGHGRIVSTEHGGHFLLIDHPLRFARSHVGPAAMVANNDADLRAGEDSNPRPPDSQVWILICGGFILLVHKWDTSII